MSRNISHRNQKNAKRYLKKSGSCCKNEIASKIKPSSPTQRKLKNDALSSDLSLSPKGWCWENDMTCRPTRWILRLKNESDVIDISNDAEEVTLKEVISVRRSTRSRHSYNISN